MALNAEKADFSNDVTPSVTILIAKSTILKPRAAQSA